MLGVVLFAVGIIGVIAFALTGSSWVIGAAAASVALGILLLDQVGRSLP